MIRSNPGASVYENQGDQSFEGDQEMSKVKQNPGKANKGPRGAQSQIYVRICRTLRPSRKDAAAAAVESKRSIRREKYKESRILGKRRPVKLQCATAHSNFARLDLGDTFDLKCPGLSINKHGHRSVDRPLTGETVLWG